jgi:hypothetical protein
MTGRRPGRSAAAATAGATPPQTFETMDLTDLRIPSLAQSNLPQGRHLITLGELKSEKHIGSHDLLKLFAAVDLTDPEAIVANTTIDSTGRPRRVFGIEVCLELDEADEALGIALKCGDSYIPLVQENDTLKTESGSLQGKVAFTGAKTRDGVDYTRVSVRFVSVTHGMIFNVPVLVEKTEEGVSLAATLEAQFAQSNYAVLEQYIAPPIASFVMIEDLELGHPYKVVEISEPKLLEGTKSDGKPWKSNVYQVAVVDKSGTVPVSTGFALTDQIEDRVNGWKKARRLFETISQVFGLPETEWYLVVDSLQPRRDSTEENPKFNVRARLVDALPMSFTKDT